MREEPRKVRNVAARRGERWWGLVIRYSQEERRVRGRRARKQCWLSTRPRTPTGGMLGQETPEQSGRKHGKISDNIRRTLRGFLESASFLHDGTRDTEAACESVSHVKAIGFPFSGAARHARY